MGQHRSKVWAIQLLGWIVVGNKSVVASGLGSLRLRVNLASLIGAVALVLLFSALPAQAQVPPIPQPPVNAGSLLEEVERQRPPAAAPRTGPLLDVPPLLAPSGGPSVEFTVNRFEFTGNTKVSSQRLSQALADYLNRPITFEQLQEATNLVADTYAQAGWLARAFLPRQDITEGVVRIQVIEAVYGGSIIDGQFNHVAESQIQGILAAQIHTGQVLSLTDVERALLLADDMPGITVVGSLTAGKETGQTAVLVNVDDTPLISGQVQVDNLGNKSTGQNEVSLNANINGLAGWGDQATIYGLYTEGLSFVSVGYSVPVLSSGLRLGASYSTLGYRIIDAALAAAKGSGYANTWSVEATQPLLRSRNTNVFGRLAYTSKQFDNRAGSITTSNYTVDQVALSLTASHLDSFGGGGYTVLTLTPSIGDVNYGGAPEYADLVSLTTRSEGNYAKLRYGLSRQQNLSSEWSVFANWRGQIASKNLDSSERFYLGGPFGVRAYPNNEGGGSQGNLLSLELRYRPWQALQVAGFWDVGHVEVNKSNNFPGAAQPNSATLQGVGLSVSWQAPYNVLINATWATRIGSNPFANQFGRDQDGSFSRNRFWLNASIAF